MDCNATNARNDKIQRTVRAFWMQNAVKRPRIATFCIQNADGIIAQRCSS